MPNSSVDCRRGGRGFRPLPPRVSRDSSAVSVVTGYIMTLSIATILLTVLILANQAYLSGVAGTTLYSSLSTLGSDLTLRISNLDRLVNASASLAGNLSGFSLTMAIPVTLAGETYALNITNQFVLLTPSRLTQSAVRIPMNLTQPVTNTTLTSSTGEVVITYNDSTNSLEFR